MRLMFHCTALLKRDFLLVYRSRGDVFHALGFYIFIASLFPLAIGPDPELLKRFAPAVVWIGMIMASLLPLSSVFDADYQDGTLDLMRLHEAPLALLILVRWLAYFIGIQIPLLLVSPWVALAYGYSVTLVAPMMLLLLPGTAIMTLIGLVGSAITVGTRQGSALLALVVLPLYVPVLIFGASGLQALAALESAAAQLQFLLSMGLLALVIAPTAAAAALKIQLE